MLCHWDGARVYSLSAVGSVHMRLNSVLSIPSEQIDPAGLEQVQVGVWCFAEVGTDSCYRVLGCPKR